MKCTAGFLTLGCAWMMILIQELAAGPAQKRFNTRPSCNLKDQMVLTRNLIEESLSDFDSANGMNLGNWHPGFPELRVHQNSTPHQPKVQCSLLFLGQGLEMVLEDQENDLNPKDTSLHKKLRHTIQNIKMLAQCMQSVLGGECLTKPPQPKMPKQVFGKKQWSHTLLKSGGHYLAWLEHKFAFHISKVKETNETKHKATKAAPQK